RPDVVPADFRAEGLLERMAAEELRGARVLLPRAAGARAVLPDELRARGALVDEVVTYRAVVPQASVARLQAALDGARLDCVTFTSSSTVTSFLQLLDAADPRRGRARLRDVAVACIGPVTADTARQAGLAVAITPREYTIAALADAIVAHFAADD